MLITSLLLAVPILLLVYFGFFAAYNYAYAFGALSRRRPPTVAIRPDASVAVVIVSFNEREVIADTVAACERLSYQNKTIIVGDDSKDPETIALLRRLAVERGCVRVDDARYADTDIELWESDRFVVFHRADNVGFKAGNLSTLEQYLRAARFHPHVPARRRLAPPGRRHRTLPGGDRRRSRHRLRPDQAALPLRPHRPLPALPGPQRRGLLPVRPARPATTR